MKISLDWLKEFVAVTAGPKELRAGLTNLGLGVESVAEVPSRTTKQGGARGETVFEIEVTTNRPDCLSHLGVARELATLYRLPLKRLKVKVKESSRPSTRAVSIEIADADLCARYSGRVIENVEVKPSPAWLAERLEAVGLRPINNVADVTNYVLMELGHPLHAFDLARLGGPKIIVRRARAGERLRTLDGVDRTLTSENLVIADAERPVALAGVMGGEESEISASTRAVLLESAWFDPVSIRRTAKSQGLHTEASHRFERGADIEMAPVALDRAAQLIAEVAGGEILRGIVDVYPAPRRPRAITLRSSEILRILGCEVPAKDVERTLRSLDFNIAMSRLGKSRPDSRKSKGAFDSSWKVTPPSFRLDVSREIDLIEEIARHYGYDRLPSRLRTASRRIEEGGQREKELAVANLLAGLGFYQICPTSMMDPEENARFTERPPVRLGNPLSQEASVLRSTTVPSMLQALGWNLDRGRQDLRLYEVGKIYVAKPASAGGPERPRQPAGGLPDERRVLTLGMCGARREASVHEPERALDFFDLKGSLEALMEAFDARGLGLQSEGGAYYEPRFAARFLLASRPLAIFGRLASRLAREYKFPRDVWLAEVDYDHLLELPLRARSFRPFSKFPAVERDFSLLVPKGTLYARLAEALAGAGVEEVQDFCPVERLPEGQIRPDYYSLLLRVTFQSATRTLTREEIAEAERRLTEALAPLGVRLRS
jgi:phenylalanyl-tRNA synthetase beta chain